MTRALRMVMAFLRDWVRGGRRQPPTMPTTGSSVAGAQLVLARRLLSRGAAVRDAWTTIRSVWISDQVQDRQIRPDQASVEASEAARMRLHADVQPSAHGSGHA